MAKIKPLMLEIEKELWNEFKSYVRKDKTLNDAVVELIRREVGKEKLTATDILNKTELGKDLMNDIGFRLIELMKQEEAKKKKKSS